MDLREFFFPGCYLARFISHTKAREKSRGTRVGATIGRQKKMMIVLPLDWEVDIHKDKVNVQDQFRSIIPPP